MREQAPKPVHAKVWQVLRGLGEFTMADAAIIAGVNEHAVYAYIGQLRRCGYVRTVGRRKGEGRKGEKVFRLVKNTGPKPPRWTGALHDPNLNAFVGGCRDRVD